MRLVVKIVLNQLGKKTVVATPSNFIHVSKMRKTTKENSAQLQKGKKLNVYSIIQYKAFS